MATLVLTDGIHTWFGAIAAAGGDPLLGELRCCGAVDEVAALAAACVVDGFPAAGVCPDECRRGAFALLVLVAVPWGLKERLAAELDRPMVGAGWLSAVWNDDATGAARAGGPARLVNISPAAATAMVIMPAATSANGERRGLLSFIARRPFRLRPRSGGARVFRVPRQRFPAERVASGFPLVEAMLFDEVIEGVALFGSQLHPVPRIAIGVSPGDR
ncbi:hypothetical protein GCM10011492_09910 [Flexivirga endophytica]|uniref:Uncharacterized protein n=1 Tax=Flexivirga endophytica TaxID=1849103 RepID=A0A916WQ41_9MICO|nr:hypothetical protein GCM10011492_09910 [Flexivirga endophytica]GHB59622.1 hypothetical protein GCM10008112_30930 [Flexivirga endophytica]